MPTRVNSSTGPFAAMLLAAGLEGIRDGLDPGEPNLVNAYRLSAGQRAERGLCTLPRTLGEAIEAFAADPETSPDPWSGVEEMIVVGSGSAAELLRTSNAVTAFDAQDLSNKGIDSIERVSQFTPNLALDARNDQAG